MKTVLLLVPPSDKYCMRDYYCSKISKTDYYHHPIDFIILSGILTKQYKVVVLDCIAEHLDDKSSLERIFSVNADVVIFLTGAVSFDSDALFLKQVKNGSGALLIGAGDIFLDSDGEILRSMPFVDAILMDFTTTDILRYIEGDLNSTYNIIYRNGSKLVKKNGHNDIEPFNIPLPRHELFLKGSYVFPFARNRKFATILTSFGCPFSCAYCGVSRFKFKQRQVTDVIEEVRYIKKLGISEIFIKDQTFPADILSGKQFCSQIISEGFDLSWTCFSRAELVNESLLFLMKKAGCHTIIFGVESVNTGLLSSYGRDLPVARIEHVFNMCRHAGIQTVATFILGIPGDSRDHILQTIAFSKKIKCDFASFNIYTPAYGSRLRYELIEKGIVADKCIFMDSGVSYPVVSTNDLSSEEVWGLRNLALRSFYLRPGYLVDKLINSRIPWDILLSQAVGLLKDALTNKFNAKS